MKPAWVLIALSLTACLAAEFTARALQQFSHFYRRVHLESGEAVRLRHAGPGQPRTLFFAGNSLLEYGIDVPQLNRAIAPRFAATRFVLEGSAFYDWYYGLQSLFDRGMRPDAVVLCLNARFLADPVLPDQFSAYLLLDLASIASLARDLHPGASVTADLYAAHFSALYGTGPELRRVLLDRLLPSPNLWEELLPPDSPVQPSTIRDRLAAMRDLCRAHGSSFLFLVPPARTPGADMTAAGIRVLHPLSLDPDPGHYRDGYHLNAVGAGIFTAAVARGLLLDQ